MIDFLPKLLTPPEVQQVLRISPATYYRWLKAKKLPARYIHGRWRFPLPDVQRLLDSRPADK